VGRTIVGCCIGGQEEDSGVMEKEQPEYLSYLLRLWRVSDDKEPAWRALLKSAHTGRQVGFGGLDALFDYLRSEAGLEPEKNKVGAIGGGCAADGRRHAQ
jgi:hypothetical protein